MCAFAGAAVAYAVVGRADDADACLEKAADLAHALRHLFGLVDLVEQARSECAQLAPT